MNTENNSLSDKLFELGTPIGGLLLYPGEIYNVDETGNKVLKDKFLLGGWLEANGQTVKKSEYPDLYQAIGEIYNTGDEDTGSFCLPDMRGLLILKNTEEQMLPDDFKSLGSPLEEPEDLSESIEKTQPLAKNLLLYYLIKAK